MGRRSKSILRNAVSSLRRAFDMKFYVFTHMNGQQEHYVRFVPK